MADSLRTSVRAFSGFLRAQFEPLVRSVARWSAWPGDAGSYTPNWQVYEVVFDLPGNHRVTVLWNGDGVTRRVRIPRRASKARLSDGLGGAVGGPAAVGQDWAIDLPPATAHFAGDPDGYYFIGGDPRLLFEDNVPPDSPSTPPRLG